MRTRTMIGALVAGLVLGITTVGVAAPAHARNECLYTSGVFCVYRLSFDGGTAWWEATDNNRDYYGDIFDNGYGLDNRVSSVNNRTMYPVAQYQYDAYGGALSCILPYTKKSYSGDWFDNRASSHKNGTDATDC